MSSQNLLKLWTKPNISSLVYVRYFGHSNTEATNIENWYQRRDIISVTKQDIISVWALALWDWFIGIL